MDKEVKLQPKKPGFFFKGYRACIKATKKKVKFIYMGEHFEDGSLILSNHESTKGPLSWDFFCDKQVRFLGTEEMNSGLKRMYKYQTEIYYHEKKHWPLWAARLFCLLASPLTNLFYKGLDLISIKANTGFMQTIADAYTSLTEYKENLVIFPEDSTTGYHEEMVGFKKGFLLIAQYAYKRGNDLPIVVSYYNKNKSTIHVSEPVKYSKLLEEYKTKDAIAEHLKDVCNELGRVSREDQNLEK